MANIIEQLLQLSQKAGNSLSSGSVSAEGILQQLGMLPAQENVMQPQARQAISQSGGANQMKQQAQQAPQGLDNPMAIAFAKKAEAELGKRAGQAAAEMPSDQLAEVVKTHGMVNDRIKNPDFKLRNGSTETMDMTANDGSNVLQGLLGGLRNFIASGGNVNEQGVAEPLRLLGGLLQENPSMTLQRQQAFALTPQGEKMKAEANLPAELAKEQIKTMGTFATKDLERRDKFFGSLSEPASGETVKQVSLIEKGLTGIDNMSQLLGISMDNNTGKVSINNADLFRNKNFLDKNRQSLQRARDVYINSILRRDSGAAIGKEELKNFEKIMGFDIGMKAYLQNPEVIAKSIMESKLQLQRDRGRLIPNEETRQLTNAWTQAGFSKEEQWDELKRLGRV